MMTPLLIFVHQILALVSLSRSSNCLHILTLATSLATVSFTIIFVKYDSSWVSSALWSSGIFVLVAVSTFLSAQLRFILQLSIVNLLGPQSRLLLMSSITGLLLTNPIRSIVHNLHEVSHMTECMLEMVEVQSSNLTDVHSQLCLSTMAGKEMVKIKGHIENAVKSLHNKVLSHVRSVCDKEMISSFNIKGLKEDCKGNVNSIRKYCRIGSNDLYDNCVMGITGLLKKPGEWIDGLRGLFKYKRSVGGETMCSPLQYLTSSCDTLLDTAESLCEQLDEGKLNPLLSSLGEVCRLGDAIEKEIRLNVKLNADGGFSLDANNYTRHNVTSKLKSARADFASKFRTITTVLHVLQICLTIPLWAVPLFSWLYLRRARKKLLDNNSTCDTSDPRSRSSTFFSKYERKQRRKVIPHLLLFFLHILLSSSVLTFDYFLYSTQQVVRENGVANISTGGSYRVNVEFETGGLFANEGVNLSLLDESRNLLTSNQRCLPHPIHPTKIEALFVLALLYTFTGSTFAFQCCLSPIRKKIVENYLKVCVERREKSNYKFLMSQYALIDGESSKAISIQLNVARTQ